jgi:tetratricopeptide (TPR) repeat protein
MLVHSILRWRNIVGALFLALCFTISVSAQISSIPDSQSQTGFGGIHSIVGTVFAPSGRPLESRSPIRLATMTRGDRVFTLSETGNFAFRGLPSGSYIITIDKEADFKPYTASVDVIAQNRPPAQTYTLNIRLEYKDRTKVTPPVLNAEFANVPKKALDFYNAALEKAKTGDHSAAVDQLKLALVEYPTFTQAFNEMGVQYLRLNRLEDADEAFRGALKIDPESFAAMINRGIANVMMKRYGESVPILRKALKKNEQSAVGHYFLGQALANLGLFDEAEKELRTSLQLGKEEMKEAHRILAIIYASRGKKKEAVGELEAYLARAPNTPDAEALKEQIRKLKEPN